MTEVVSILVLAPYIFAILGSIFSERITVGWDDKSFCIGIRRVTPKAEFINMELIQINFVPVVTIFIAVRK